MKVNESKRYYKKLEINISFSLLGYMYPSPKSFLIFGPL